MFIFNELHDFFIVLKLFIIYSYIGVLIKTNCPSE